MNTEKPTKPVAANQPQPVAPRPPNVIAVVPGKGKSTRLAKAVLDMAAAAGASVVPPPIAAASQHVKPGRISPVPFLAGHEADKLRADLHDLLRQWPMEHLPTALAATRSLLEKWEALASEVAAGLARRG